MKAFEVIEHRYEVGGERLWTRLPSNYYADLAFADPPYNYGFDYADDPSGDKRDPDAFRAWIGDTIHQVAATVRFGGMLFWLCPAEQGTRTQPLLELHGTLLHGKPIIWHERFSQYQAKRLTSDYRLQGNAKDRVYWHPAQLPPEPLDRIVRGWTNPGDTVIDAFAGSGSMGVAALKAGRGFIGVDGSPTYCAKLQDRLSKVAGEVVREEEASDG